MDKAYIETVRLLVEAVPVVFDTPALAMKGGTAINLFVEDMPRLSVDIDVVFTAHQVSRESALQSISLALETARRRLAAAGLDAEVSSTEQGGETKLFLRRGRNQVKVEVNHVFRGTILPVERRGLGAEARRVFTAELVVPVLAVPELYGSKLVAALDRQHPRDLFDLRGLFERGGLTPEVVECFVCYLAGHNRPVHEVLFSRDHDIAQAFENEFVGLTRQPITLDELVSVRRRLRRELPAALSDNHRQFLVGLAAAQPEWDLMTCPHLAELPAIRWKLQNLARLKKANPQKFARQADELRARFAL
jgi:hypothetical protein